MKAETVDDLVNWTRDTHGLLARRLRQSADQQSRTRSELLMRYLADHEAALEKMVAEYEGRADQGSLGTWVYDYVTENPVHIDNLDADAHGESDVEEISATIFAVHTQLIGLYRYLLGRADTPDLRDLIKELLALEQHEAMRLAHQVNRVVDV
ncbi:hypothetical protein [Chromatocurvus halotolerans]|uniref:ATPase n=1 Tax=Chromatocurvus halotolerans TaxID=1132028 RepID=A0A4R2KTE9_9GAMM|nr:hypothetical protein [Chromatocurvus halotolerans]TCO76102.1 hypothetical protein EV688_10562 [Chromatocurvus halotolerans]